MGLKTSLGLARAGFARHAGRWVWITAALLGLELVASAAAAALFGAAGAVAAQLLVYPFWGTYVALAAQVHGGARPQLGSALRAVWSRPLAWLALSLIAYAGLLGWGIGVLLSAGVTLFAPVYLLRGAPVLSAVQLSAKQVLKHWKTALGVLSILGALSFSSTLTACVGLLVTLPFSALLLVVVQDATQLESAGLGGSGPARSNPQPVRLQHARQRGATFVEYLIVVVTLLLIAVGAVVAYQRVLSVANDTQGQAVMSLTGTGRAPVGDEWAGSDDRLNVNPHAADSTNWENKSHEQAEDAPWWKRLLGGFVDAVWDDLKGIIDFAKELWNDPWGTLKGAYDDARSVVDAFKNDPWGTTKALFFGLVWDEESQDAWARGDYATAIGRTAWNVGSFFIPGAGIATKLSKASKLARKFDDLAGAARRADGDSPAGHRSEPGGDQHGDRGDGDGDRNDGDRNDGDRNDGDCSGGQCTAPGKSCFVAGTRVDSASGPVPIESVKLGQRVGAVSEACEAADFREFAHVELRLQVDDAPDSEVDLELLRPSAWLQQHAVSVGSELRLELDEMALVGTAHVLSVGPAPVLAAGDRCPVTGLVRHTAAAVMSLTMLGGAQLELTGEHRLFSASRQQWVMARELVPGEFLQTRSGVLAIDGKDDSARGPTEVFNLEVYDQHYYFVGDDQIWAHNNYNDDDPPRELSPTEASVADKLDRYLLNPDHPVGGPKAKWFEQALGYTRENADDLAKQIEFDESKAVETGDTPHGTKYNQTIDIEGANGRHIDVNFAWIRNNDGVVRLVTAIPTKK